MNGLYGRMCFHQPSSAHQLLRRSSFIMFYKREDDMAHREYMNAGNVHMSEAASKILLDDVMRFIQILFSGL